MGGNSYLYPGAETRPETAALVAYTRHFVGPGCGWLVGLSPGCPARAAGRIRANGPIAAPAPITAPSIWLKALIVAPSAIPVATAPAPLSVLVPVLAHVAQNLVVLLVVPRRGAGTAPTLPAPPSGALR